MELVNQDDNDGCVVACFATVTGKTYEEALHTLHLDGPPAVGASTDLNVLIRALEAEGFSLNIRPRCTITELKTSILLVRYEIEGEMFMHTVVWDAECQEIFDPFEFRPHEIYQQGFCLAFEITGRVGT
jgi:hypothetical protein